MTHDELVALRAGRLTDEDTRIWMHLMCGKGRTPEQNKVATSAYPSITHVAVDFTKYNDEQTMHAIEAAKLRCRNRVLDYHLRGYRHA